MPHPTIGDAKALATKYRKRGVVILSFDADQYGVASFGHTRADCSAMRGVVEQIGDLIRDELIEIPDGFGATPVDAAVEAVIRGWGAWSAEAREAATLEQNPEAWFVVMRNYVGAALRGETSGA